MTYQVIARKWRPQQFDDVIGQQTITRTLQNAIRLGRVAHAYLFTGTRGVGKTSTARIMAKALNCHKGPTPTPCDACPSCLEIMQANSVDVLEIDAASNRGIGEIRELRENVQYAPSRDRYKIFIIDEVHMLTPEAFNALLKTLEEPPAHVVFILATTELYKIPHTILSRCQQFDFRIIPFKQIHSRLRMILDAENVRLSDQAVNFVVKAGGGSMRDAESALQKIISLGGEEVSDEDVAALLGVIRQDMLNRMMKAVMSQNRAAIITIIDELYDRGHDLQNFIRSFIEFVRQISVFKISQDKEHLTTLSAEDIQFLKETAQELSVEDLIRYYEMLVKADNELRWTPFIRFHTEMAFLRLASMPHLASLEEIISALRDIQDHPMPLAPEMPPAQPDHVVAGLPATSADQSRMLSAESAADSEKLGLFLKRIGSRLPPIQPFVSKVSWSLKGNRVRIVLTENSIYDKTFRLPSTQADLIKVYKELFGQEPEIDISTRKSPAPPDKTEIKKKNLEKQVQLEDLFRQDPIIRILTDKLSGRWTYKDQND